MKPLTTSLTIGTQLKLLVCLTTLFAVKGQYLNSCGCSDVQPPEVNCDHQKFILNNCDSKWIVEEDYCAFTCDRCICEGDCACTDHPPDAQYSCKELLFYEKCEEPWMLAGNHCEFSCGRCTCASYNGTSEVQGDQQTAVPIQQSTFILGENSPVQSPQVIAAAPQTLPCDQQFVTLLESNADTAYLSPLFASTPLMTLFQSEDELPLTLFLPNQKSWNSLLVTLNNQNDLLNNPTLILQTLGGHVAAGEFNYNQLQNYNELQTLLENINLKVTFSNGILAVGFDGNKKIQVKQNAQKFCSTMVYVIDGVLIPKESQLNQLMAVTDHFLNIVVEEDDYDEGEEIDIIYAPSTESLPQPLPQPQKSKNNGQCKNTTALEFINTHPQLKQMRKLLQKIDIGNILERTDFNMTLFFPIDSAQITAGDAGNRNQASLLQLDPQVIRDIVLYHIVQQDLVELDDFKGTRKLFSMSNNRFLTLESGEPYNKVLGQSYSANIIDVNIVNACTVRIHLIDRVLMPYSPEKAQELYPTTPSPQPQSYCGQSVWQIITALPGLSVLQGVRSDIDQALLQSQPMTVFLPDARGQAEITQLSQELAGVLESEANIAYDLLLYHIIPNLQINLTDGSEAGIYESLAQLPLEVASQGDEYYVQGTGASTKVLATGSTSTCNPVMVHNIEGALFPFPKENSGTKGIPTVEELQLAASQSDAQKAQCNVTNSILDYIREEPKVSFLVEKAGDQLEQFLSPIDGMVTYFLPVNEAMDELTQNQAVMKSFKNENELVGAILQYHAVPDKLLTGNAIAREPTRETNFHVTRFNTINLSMKKQFGSVMLFGQMGIGRIIEMDTFESCSAVVHLIDTALLPFPIEDNNTPSPIPIPSSSPSATFSVGGQYEVAAVEYGLSRGDSVYGGNFQVVDTTLSPSPIIATPTLGSDISQFFPSSSDATAPEASSESQEACNKTIGDLFEQMDRLSQMGRYLRLAGFANYLDQTNANITIIAPIESAFDAELAGYTNLTLRMLAQDESQRELFVRIISYHIIPSPVNVKNMPAGARGSFGTLEFDDDGYQMQLIMRKMVVPFGLGEDIVVEGKLNNATVSGSPLNFCKAYVYPVDKVLSLNNQADAPPPPPFIPSVPTVYRPEVNADSLLPDVTVSTCIEPMQIIQNQNDLSTFIQLIYYAQINDIINNLDNITIFAPSDVNFNQILSDFPLASLGEEGVKNWMAYHIVTGVYSVEDLQNGMKLDSLTVDSQGNNMNLEVVRGNGTAQNSKFLEGEVYLQGGFNEAYISLPNLKACNAMVHIVNFPLLPVG